MKLVSVRTNLSRLKLCVAYMKNNSPMVIYSVIGLLFSQLGLSTSDMLSKKKWKSWASPKIASNIGKRQILNCIPKMEIDKKYIKTIAVYKTGTAFISFRYSFCQCKWRYVPFES